MSTNRRRRLFVVILVTGSILSGCSNGGAVDTFTIKGAPMKLPTSQLAPVDAKNFQRILVGLRGKPVLVNIWASWCVPCRAEAPILRRASADLDGKVVFLGVAARDDPAASQAFLDEFSITYPNLSDQAGEVPSLVAMRGYPTTIAIDRNGKIRGSSFGGLTENRLAALLSEIE